MKKIKLGIIGCGNIGSQHYSNVLNGRCPEVEVCAIADANKDRLDWASKICTKYQATNPDIPSVALFTDASAMLSSGIIDAVIISVPHYEHPKYAIEAFQKGIHVMCEKPAGVYTLQVREMIAEADKHPELKFGMMLKDCFKILVMGWGYP